MFLLCRQCRLGGLQPVLAHLPISRNNLCAQAARVLGAGHPTPPCSLSTNRAQASNFKPVRASTFAAAYSTVDAAHATAQDPQHAPEQQQQQEWCVVNFYHLVAITDPEEMVARHRHFLAATTPDVRGRIYISSQGINCQCGGPADQGRAYADWVAAQPEMQGMRYSLWPASGHTFPKLRLKLRPNLISLAGGMEALPVTDAAQRATPLPPRQWREMMAAAKRINAAVERGEAPESERVVVLDIRNDYEWDAGHFEGAARPAEEEFADTPVGDSDDGVPQALQDAPLDANIMMYCTGGIRCDVYSAWLRQKGFNNMYTLEGGVQGYLREEGGEHWRGGLFVFDGRMAIGPGGDQASTSASGAIPAAVPCRVCGASSAELPHVNCANIDCNELFVACADCKVRLHGCCCAECTSAPRLLRPVKLEGGYYGSWGNYADDESLSQVMASGRSSEGRLARRTRRREALRQKRAEFLEARRSVKTAARNAMAAREAAQGDRDEAAEGVTVPGALAAAVERLRLRRHAQQEQAGAAAVS